MKELEDKIESLKDSIQFGIFFDNDQEDEFSELLMHKIIDNFDPDDQERIFYKNALAWYQK